MNKIITLALMALVSAVVLVGCDQNKTSSTEAGGTATSTNAAAAGTNTPAK